MMEPTMQTQSGLLEQSMLEQRLEQSMCQQTSAVQEINDLRAELIEVRRLLEAALADTKDYMDIVEEKDRLQTEVARLRMALEYVSDHDPDKPGLHGELIDILRSAVVGAKAALTTNSSSVE